jgi:hypothetical protein
MYAHLLKVGHFTMDNALNNGMMMHKLKAILAKHDIKFDADDCRIMYFAHVINLCSGQVIRGVNRKVDGDDSDFPMSDGDSASPDIIAKARAAV